MAAIGVELEPVPLVLTRGRDFRWKFTNVDEHNNPVPFPAGDLFFEIQTRGEHNNRQRITTYRANGGTYTPSFDGSAAAACSFDDESSDIQSKLAALPNVGAGNVVVRGAYYPQWILTVTLSGAAEPTLPNNVQRALEAAVRETLDGLEFLGLGRYDLEGVYEPPTWTFTVTDRTGMSETAFLTYVVDIISTGIQTAIRAIGGVLNSSTVTVAQFYTPKRVFDIEFTGALKNKPLPQIDVSSALTGSDPYIEVQTIKPGKEPLTIWPLTISGSDADIKVESEDADLVSRRTRWQLVFMPDGEPAGGDPVTRGRVMVQE